MEKIIILGSSGAGKSTLARTLAPIRDIEVFHLDRLLWEDGWKEKNESTRIELLEKLAFERKQWIIDGNYLRFSELHVKAADTIIFLDTHPFICLGRLLKRHMKKYHKYPRHDIPNGCRDRLTLRRLWKVLTFPSDGRKIIEQTLKKYENKKIIRLKSKQEVEEFLIQQQLNVDNKSSLCANSFEREEVLITEQPPKLVSLLE